MKYWTVHLKSASSDTPMLVREGFSFAAFLFGPIWLLAHRAWIPALLLIAANVLVGALAPEAAEPLLLLGIMLFVGLAGIALIFFISVGALVLMGYTLGKGQRDEVLDRVEESLIRLRSTVMNRR